LEFIMVTLSKIATACAELVQLQGGLLRFGGVAGTFSGGGLASALWNLDWPASATLLPQVAFLTGLLLLVLQVAELNGSSGISELAGARRARNLITSP
jgi:hypothetical protein